MRKQITQKQIDSMLAELKIELERRLKNKGYGTFASTHEIMGAVDEEVYEMHDAVRENNKGRVKEELLDIAVGAVFGATCISADTVDW